MIEDATLKIGDREIKTRLHEHGWQEPGPYAGSYIGYFDGRQADMEFLMQEAPEEVEVFSEGRLVKRLSAVRWLEAVENYPAYKEEPEYWITHLEWDDEVKG